MSAVSLIKDSVNLNDSLFIFLERIEQRVNDWWVISTSQNDWKLWWLQAVRLTFLCLLASCLGTHPWAVINRGRRAVVEFSISGTVAVHVSRPTLRLILHLAFEMSLSYVKLVATCGPNSVQYCILEGQYVHWEG